MSLVEDALRRLRATVGNAATVSPAPAAPAQARRDRPPALAVAPAIYAKRQFGDATHIVHIDAVALRQSGLVAPEDQEHQLAQQYRSIKRPLIKTAFEPDGIASGELAPSRRSIMVSSALPGDGKTFTSLNLALSLSKEQDFSVLLIDGDVGKPHLSRVLGVADREGLIDALSDPARAPASVVMPTTVPGLSFLPVGRRSESMTELLSSARMPNVVHELLDMDPQLVVVVDSPPILLTSEARVLASLFGQVLMVVRAGVTPRHATTEALRIMGEGAPVKLVLNEAVHSPAASYYGYGYGYGDGKR